MSASSLATLFEQISSRVNELGISYPNGVTNTIPTPAPRLLAARSKYNCCVLILANITSLSVYRRAVPHYRNMDVFLRNQL